MHQQFLALSLSVLKSSYRFPIHSIDSINHRIIYRNCRLAVKTHRNASGLHVSPSIFTKHCMQSNVDKTCHALWEWNIYVRVFFILCGGTGSDAICNVEKTSPTEHFYRPTINEGSNRIRVVAVVCIACSKNVNWYYHWSLTFVVHFISTFSSSSPTYRYT